MIAIFLSPFYIAFNYYILRWLIKWLESFGSFFKKRFVTIFVAVIYILLASSLLFGFLLPNNDFGRIVKATANYWLGTLLYIILVVLVADLLRHIVKWMEKKKKKEFVSSKRLKIFGGICLFTIIGVSLLGVFEAHHIVVTTYQVVIDKEVEKRNDLQIVMVADLHLGYNTTVRHIHNMVTKINQENPDIVVIAGDIFDNDYDAIKNPSEITKELKNITSKYGTYAVYGNHDVSEKILVGFTFSSKKDLLTSDHRMDEMLENASVTLLRDESVLIDDSFYLYGRPDYAKVGMKDTVRKTSKELVEGLDQTKPIIVIDHEPRELKELASAGVDLDLSGHTHDGQVFPFNVFMPLFFDNCYGMKEFGNMTSIVTSGIGVYGPNMRVATKAEITSIKVKFQ